MSRPCDVFTILVPRYRPTMTAGLANWFSTVDRGSIVLDGSNRVEIWRDLGPFGRNASQTNASLRPTFHTSQLRGYPALRGDGSTYEMEFQTPDLSKGYTVYAVHGRNGSGRTIVSRNGSGGAGNAMILYGTSASTGSGGFTYPGTPPSAGYPLAAVLKYDGTSPVGAYTLAANYIADVTSSAQPQNAGTPSAGTGHLFSSGGAGYALNYNVFEVILFDRQLPLSEDFRVRRYITETWGLPWA